MFVERLLAGLISPQNRLGELDDTLVVDIDHYRALLMREARVLSEAGQIDRAVAGWAFTCIADGWVDEHLLNIRDCLLELGAVADQEHLDRLLRAAVLQILGATPNLQPADVLLLETVTQPNPRGDESESLGVRLLARHYAKELGLLSRASGVTERTPLGDTALKLPRHSLPGYLLALEVLQSAGNADRWRTPRRALAHLLESREFDVPATAQARRVIDPEGLLPWRRVRRLALMGLCEPVPEPEAPAPAADDRPTWRYRLLPYGEEALRQVLREPPSEVVRIAEAVLAEQTRQAMRPLLQRTRSFDPFQALPKSAAAAPVPEHQAPPAPASPGKANGVPVTVMRPAVAQTQGRNLAPSPPSTAPAVERTAPPPRARPEPESFPPPAERAPEPAAPSIELDTEAMFSEPTAVGELRDSPKDMKDMQALQELDLLLLIRRAWEELHARQVCFNLLGGAPRILGDRRVLLQACRELLRSAAESAQQGQATPTVTIELIAADEEVVLLCHDNGPPLSAADREGILDVSFGMISEGPRTGLVRAHRSLLSQGAGLSLLPPRLGGTSVRVLIPRTPRYFRREAA